MTVYKFVASLIPHKRELNEKEDVMSVFLDFPQFKQLIANLKELRDSRPIINHEMASIVVKQDDHTFTFVTHRFVSHDPRDYTLEIDRDEMQQNFYMMMSYDEIDSLIRILEGLKAGDISEAPEALLYHDDHWDLTNRIDVMAYK